MEENNAFGKNWKPIIAVAIVVVVVVAAVGVYLLYPQTSGITAKEGYIQANNQINMEYELCICYYAKNSFTTRFNKGFSTH